MGVAMLAQTAQKNKFAISQQYFKKAVRTKFDFVYED